MSIIDRVVLASVIALASFVGGWAAKGVKAERDELKGELAQVRGARVLEARDRRVAGEESADYQKVLQQIRTVVATIPSQEEKDALRAPIQCAPGASSVEFGDVPVPAVMVNRLRSAAVADQQTDQSAAR
ncbi:MAG: hypothetical protein EOP37_03170 [Rubrivivax sp.]|nr:MAG: hypothetical protein EOP37_03170 [Rubrivivax sp.]